MILRLRRTLSVDSGVSWRELQSRHLMIGSSAIPLWHASRTTKICFAGRSETARSHPSRSRCDPRREPLHLTPMGRARYRVGPSRRASAVASGDARAFLTTHHMRSGIRLHLGKNPLVRQAGATAVVPAGSPGRGRARTSIGTRTSHGSTPAGPNATPRPLRRPERRIHAPEGRRLGPQELRPLRQCARDSNPADANREHPPSPILL